MHPFGYTGYRYDNVADTYFVQAREYLPVWWGGQGLNFFKLEKCKNKMCWKNFMEIIKGLEISQQEQLIPFLFECLRDLNWPIFEPVIRDALHLIRRKCYEKDDDKIMCYFNRHFMYVLYV